MTACTAATASPPSAHLADALATARAWLAADGPATLVVTGPSGMGKSLLLEQLPSRLSSVLDGDGGDLVVWARSNLTCDDARHLAQSVAAQSARTQRDGAEDDRTLLVVVDDIDVAPPQVRDLVFDLPRREPGVRLLVAATVADGVAGLEDAMQLPLAQLDGSLETSVADWEEFVTRPIVRAFVDCLHRRNPAFEPQPADHGALARICATSFGIPAELDLLAELVDRHGVAAIGTAVADVAARQHLADFVDDLAPSRTDLSPDEVIVLASVFAAPGGATVDLLRHTLPRCDVAATLRELTDRGLVHGTVDAHEHSPHTRPNRFHLRVSAMQLAAWCTCQSEVSFAAVRHAHADYLQAGIARMTNELFGDGQQAVFAEFRQELPNLRATISELIGMAQFDPVVSLMWDALPLLDRSCGVAEILPDVLRVVRAHEPASTRDAQRLAMLTIHVLAAAGEQEAAAIHLDELITAEPGLKAGPDIALLRVLVAEQPDDDALDSLADTITTCRHEHDLQRLAALTGEYFALLLRTRQFERADRDSRSVLCEATRSGDAYAAGIALLWRAAASCVSEAGTGETRRLVDRALRKLRPIGPAATYSAVRVVLDNRHLDHLGNGGVDLAMITGGLSHNDFAAGDIATTSSPALPEAEERLAERIGPRAVVRWAAAGAAADLTEMLGEMLKRRYVDQLPGSVQLPRSGVEQSMQVDPAALGHSALTAREAEVASLVATGLTNKQVAFRLQISEWTVVNHLRQVMRKLDCRSRVQVARWVTSAAGLPA